MPFDTPMLSPVLEDSDSPRGALDGRPCGPARSNEQHELFAKRVSDTTASDSTATFGSRETCRASTSSQEGSPAKTSPSLDAARDWPAAGPRYSLISFEFWRSLGLGGSSLRTSMGCYRALTAQEAETSVSSWPRWLSAGTAWPGGFSTVSFSDSPNDARVSSLSDIQLTGPLPRRFFLSRRAARGILKRANARNVKIGEPILRLLVMRAMAGLDALRMRRESSAPASQAASADTGSVPKTCAVGISSSDHSCRAARRASAAQSTGSLSCTRSRLKAMMGARTARPSERTDIALTVRTAAISEAAAKTDARRSSSRRTSAENFARLKFLAHSRTAAESQDRGTNLRRLTPLEWERLQGFPDHWTCVKSTKAGRILHATEVSETQCRCRWPHGSPTESTP